MPRMLDALGSSSSNVKEDFSATVTENLLKVHHLVSHLSATPALSILATLHSLRKSESPGGGDTSTGIENASLVM